MQEATVNDPRPPTRAEYELTQDPPKLRDEAASILRHGPYAQEGDYVGAINKFNLLVRTSPEYNQDPWVNYDMGVCVTRLGGKANADRGRQLIENAIKIQEGKGESVNEWMYIGLAEALGRGDRYDEALAQYKQAAQINPDNEQVAFLRGEDDQRIDSAWSLHDEAKKDAEEGRTQLAFIKYEKAIMLGGEEALAWSVHDKGKLFLATGFAEDAKSEFGKAVSAIPDNTWTHSSYARALEQVGSVQDLASARTEYRRALELDPHNHEAIDGVRRLDQPSSHPDAEAELREMANIEHFDVHFLFDAHVAPTKQARKAVVERLVTEMEQAFVRGEVNIFIPEETSGKLAELADVYNRAVVEYGSHEKALALFNHIKSGGMASYYPEDRDISSMRRTLFSSRRLRRIVERQYAGQDIDRIISLFSYVTAEFTALDALRKSGYDIQVRATPGDKAKVEGISQRKSFESYDDFRGYWEEEISDAQERDRGVIEHISNLEREYTDPVHLFVLRGNGHEGLENLLPERLKPKSSSRTTSPELSYSEQFIIDAIGGRNHSDDEWRRAYQDFQEQHHE